MSGLFEAEEDDRRKAEALAPAPADAPLAERMRPRTLDEVVGQAALLGEGGVLRGMLAAGLEQSLVLWGPPGVGKTTLARLVAAASGHRFEPFSAVLSGIADIKRVMREAEQRRRRSGTRTLLFVDEIHRFNKAQQDAFLPYVERGDILLVGATTENPSFEVNSALLSRARVLVLEPLDEEQLVGLLKRALAEPERGLGGALHAVDEALLELSRAADGDARRALTLLETCSLLAGRGGELSPSILARALGRKVVRYDKSGDQHYDLISALHKSIRNGSDDATIYWLTRMLEAGEDRDFLMRRLVRIAVEDVGLADPDALTRTVAAWDAWKRLGSPEGELAIVQAAVVLARAPKSNAAYRAYSAAREDVQRHPNAPVPLHLCNAPTGLMKALGRSEGYRYLHDDPAAAEEMECFPEPLAGRRYLDDRE
ncbi:MAG: replication-associated recombination protein A [Planctomycetota bacterium]